MADGIFDRRIMDLQSIAERVNDWDSWKIDTRIRQLQEIKQQRDFTFEEQSEFTFICLKVLSYE